MLPASDESRTHLSLHHSNTTRTMELRKKKISPTNSRSESLCSVCVFVPVMNTKEIANENYIFSVHRINAMPTNAFGQSRAFGIGIECGTLPNSFRWVCARSCWFLFISSHLCTLYNVHSSPFSLALSLFLSFFFLSFLHCIVFLLLRMRGRRREKDQWIVQIKQAVSSVREWCFGVAGQLQCGTCVWFHLKTLTSHRFFFI